MFDITKLNCPKVAVDAVIERGNEIVLIKRKFKPFGLALPGGFVEYGESLEVAVMREVFEETGLDFTVQGQIRARSDPDRDPRGHIITIPFWGVGNGDPVAQDDAQEIVIIKKTEIMKQEYAFKDHQDILLEYIFVSD
jgi:ADP-ribose pyrophosphatase YjhB (NUDIX family)